MNAEQDAIMNTRSPAKFWSVTGCVDMRIEPFSPEVLKMLREERKIGSQRELAELSGIPESTLKKLEAGMSKPSLDTLAELGRFFGLFFYADWTEKRPSTEEDGR